MRFFSSVRRTSRSVWMMSTCALVICCLRSSAQSEPRRYTDSLIQQLHLQREDTNKAAALLQVGQVYWHLLKDSAHAGYYLLQSKELSEKLDYVKGIFAANRELGYLYHSALRKKEMLDANVALCLKNNLKTKLGEAYNDFGSFYFSLYTYDKALEYYDLAQKVYSDLGDSAQIVEEWRTIANEFYLQINKYNQALTSFKKCMDYYERKNPDPLKLLFIYDELGSAYSGCGAYDSALYFYNKLGELANTNGKPDSSNAQSFNWADIRFINSLSLGHVYRLKKNYARALECYNNVLAYCTETKTDIPTSLYSGYGALLLDIAEDTAAKIPAGIPRSKEEQIQKAVSFLKTLEQHESRSNMSLFTAEWNEYLFKAYALSGDFPKAYQHLLRYVEAKDSVFSADKAARLDAAEKNEVLNKIDKELADQKLQVSEERRQLLFFGTGIVLLSILSGFILRERRRSEKERKKSDALLLNILPAEVAAELKTHGSTMARHFDNVTVLFTDFADFTAAGERFSPQQLVNELDTCFKAFDEIIARYRIEKIKTIGDAYLAVAGLPHADAQHADNTVHAAKEIATFMNQRYAQLRDKTFRVRIGIHSGSVVAGIVGVKKFAYDIWGDTVNTAARMEQNCDPGKINISQATYELVKDKFTFEYRGEIEAKGKGMLKMYYVA